MNPYKKAKKLAEHYNLNISGLTQYAAVRMVKERADAGTSTIDEIYDDVIVNKGQPKKRPLATPTPPTIEAKAVEVKTETTSATTKPDDKPVALPPGSTLQQRFDVGAPAMTFNLMPPRIDVKGGDVDWPYTLQRVSQYGFVFVSGLMLGVLVSGPVLRSLALQVVARGM